MLIYYLFNVFSKFIIVYFSLIISFLYSSSSSKDFLLSSISLIGLDSYLFTSNVKLSYFFLKAFNSFYYVSFSSFYYFNECCKTFISFNS